MTSLKPYRGRSPCSVFAALSLGNWFSEHLFVGTTTSLKDVSSTKRNDLEPLMTVDLKYGSSELHGRHLQLQVFILPGQTTVNEVRECIDLLLGTIRGQKTTVELGFRRQRSLEYFEEFLPTDAALLEFLTSNDNVTLLLDGFKLEKECLSVLLMANYQGLKLVDPIVDELKDTHGFLSGSSVDGPKVYLDFSVLNLTQGTSVANHFALIDCSKLVSLTASNVRVDTVQQWDDLWSSLSVKFNSLCAVKLGCNTKAPQGGSFAFNRKEKKRATQTVVDSIMTNSIITELTVPFDPDKDIWKAWVVPRLAANRRHAGQSSLYDQASHFAEQLMNGSFWKWTTEHTEASSVSTFLTVHEDKSCRTHGSGASTERKEVKADIELSTRAPSSSSRVDPLATLPSPLVAAALDGKAESGFALAQQEKVQRMER